MIALAVALVVATADPAPAPAPAPADAPTPAPATALPKAPRIDEGAVVEAVEAVLQKGRDAVRVAVPPVADTNVARQTVVEMAIVRAILDRRREDPVTPAFLRAKLKTQAEAQALDVSTDPLKPFACDHILFASVGDEGGKAILHLRLLFTETGEVLGEEAAELGDGGKTSANAQSVRTATETLVEQIAFAVEGTGEDIRLHRIAVSPLDAQGAAKESRLDQFVQSELTRSLKRRGFLVVERAQLAEAMNQMALGQVLNEQSAPQAGKALGAQSLVVGSVNEAGAVFIVNARVVSTESGRVVGAADAQLPRDDVVTMAAVETRTPIEAALRSVVAPGWGQAYNGEGVKALAFGVGGYGGLLATAGLGVADVAVRAHYGDRSYFETVAKTSPEQAGQEAVDTRHAYEALDVAVLVAGGATVAVWGYGVVDALINAPKN